MKTQKTTLSGLFLEADAFIKNLNLKSCTIPFIINTFLPLRAKAYNSFLESKSDGKIQKNELKMFIEKFEIEYIETLRLKLKERYVDYVQQKHYNIPSEVSVSDLKKLGAYEELKQLATSIAEWSLELEILAYTIEGLKLYGLTNIEGEMKKDYVNTLKNNHKYASSTTLQSMSEYVIRKMVTFTLNKLSSISLIRGLTKMRFGTQTLIQIFMAFVLRSQVPWTLIVNSLNLPWLLGGFLCSMMLKKINNYIAVDEALGHLNQIYTTFEQNKLLLMSERRNLLDTALNVLSNNEKDQALEGSKQLSKMIESLLNPKENSAKNYEDSQELETMFDVKEVDDFVVVEDKDHKETVDDSGVLVVDW